MGSFAGGLTGSGPTPAASGPRSIGPQGCALCSVPMEFNSPPLHHLRKPFASGDRVGKRESETLSNVEVTIPVFPSYVGRILRQTRAVAEVPIGADGVERVSVGIAGDHAQAVKVARVQRDL